MLPAIRETSPVQANYLAFLEALKSAGFEGELNPDYANRTVLATDNSIYQVLPQGVIYPRHAEDLERLARLSHEPRFADIVLAPRGGGTGTNGQSLSDGLIVDISRHMNRILEINAEQGWVRVQTGVVKDQLNAALKPHGLFFAPELSTSNRATIGGMINTDASGQGSCEYGKTRDHVLELITVLLDGTRHTSRALSADELAERQREPGRVGEIHRLLVEIERDHHAAIEAKFPKLNRCLTGYDLAHIRDEQGRLNLNNILCGSEGTLGFIVEAKLNCLRIPAVSALVCVNYEDFNTALRDATDLMQAQPTSIETVDSKVLNLAKGDIVWGSVSEFFPEQPGKQLEAINLVEFTADDEAALQAKLSRLTDQLDQQLQAGSARGFSYSIALGSANVEKIWGMRKKSVGLLGNAPGEAKPIPFVEDTAVPPEHLADFIAEFRAVLDSHGLNYGMFGHVDAGVLHVRPMIDMKDPEQEKLVRRITDQVVALTQKYHGLLWGEHGKGLRSAYAPEFFGELYPQLQRIKAVFDPRNQLNPGKIATPHAELKLIEVDEAPTRGQHDRQIPVQVWQGYSEGMACNGNGLCFNWNFNDPMCPSWKATRQRIHSPKGRASLVREWLRQLSERGIDPLAESQALRQRSFVGSLWGRLRNTRAKRRGEYDFSNEVHEAMMGCLACKSCVGQCPIKVDVPSFRAKFLELYYGRYLRPLKDYFIGGLEYMVPTLAKMPWLYNGVMRMGWVQWLMARYAGMVDSPLLTGLSLDRELKARQVRWATPAAIAALGHEERQRSVVLVQDAFTSFFETPVLLDMIDALGKLGFTVLVAPFTANGKPLHVHGFLKAFGGVAASSAERLRALSGCGLPLVGVEPSMTLAYRSEYRQVLGDQAPKVQLIQEWLAGQKAHLAAQAERLPAGSFKLMAHCTEKTNAPASVQDWLTVFRALGQQCDLIAVGCCGMAGTFGHESANREISLTIYQQSWQPVVQNPAHQGQLMATGYSCRSQVKRFDEQELPHPLQVLLRQILAA